MDCLEMLKGIVVEERQFLFGCPAFQKKGVKRRQTLLLGIVLFVALQNAS